MSAKIIDGKAIADKIRHNLKKEVHKLKLKPGLAVVLIGEDPASHQYVGMKEKACEEIGFHSKKYLLDKNTGIGDILELLNNLNNDPEIHGILVQLPLPKNIDGQLVLDAIHPDKDVDGFHPMNMGNLLIGNNTITPCTPKGIMILIESTGIDISGKDAVVIGRSNIVGKPISILLQQKNATVTMCHSKTKDLKEKCQKADILVAAVGIPKLVKSDWIKPGAVVIDVGSNKVEDSNHEKGFYWCGDVDFEEAKKVAGFITPVPKGVGPMTIACLMENTLHCMQRFK